MKHHKQDRGFTLVEIMLVVVIIGILAGVVLPHLAGQRERAAINATKAQMKNMETFITRQKPWGWE